MDALSYSQSRFSEEEMLRANIAWTEYKKEEGYYANIAQTEYKKEKGCYTNTAQTAYKKRKGLDKRLKLLVSGNECRLFWDWMLYMNIVFLENKYRRC